MVYPVQKLPVWPLGHVAKPKPSLPVFGGSAGGLLVGEQRRPGNAEQPGDARSASPNLLITHIRKYAYLRAVFLVVFGIC